MTKASKAINTVYTLHGQILEVVTSAKYFVVDISSGLSWNSHIYCITVNICKKISINLLALKLPENRVVFKNSEYDQEIPQIQTADNPVAPRGKAAQPSRDTRKTN